MMGVKIHQNVNDTDLNPEEIANVKKQLPV